MKILRLLGIAAFLIALLPAAPSIAAGDSLRGAPFFLLSDASYGSDDAAMVRLETQSFGAVSEYGGVDIYVYRVKQPLDFLKSQKNLHRVDTKGDYVGDGFSNALARIWDKWWTGSRDAWREWFSTDARRAMTAQTPELRSHPLVKSPTPQSLNPKYKPLKGHELVDSFRYPVHIAKPIEPPEGVKLAGSSSEFIRSPKGNVMVPLGRREPGMYLVEAMVGDHRAATLVFVSDSIAVAKVSAKQMLVWVADRRDGKPAANARTLWSDGVGVLASGKTDKRGVVIFQREAPEKTYVFGEDSRGGVYVSENFYYDSEIYNTKLYAVTDRPLYRPGETVFVKFIGRDFRSARESSPIAAGELKLQALDPNGFPVAGQTLQMSPQTGGDTSFQLPDNASAGGYELRFVYKGDTYSAAFRVAEYQKPHFEINVLPSKRDFKTNETIEGRLQLVYPDGKPVANAKADLSVRMQRLTMIEGDLGYAGQFPLQLATDTVTTDANGIAKFELPAAKDPSRYIVSVLATDGAAYRVRATKEILVERGANTYTLKSDRAFSAAGDSVAFAIRALAGAANQLAGPASWEWIRLENRKKESGKLSNGERFSLTFPEAGTYMVSLRDAADNIIGAASHYVSGGGVGAPQGSIGMVFDKPLYKPGETASALITFPQPVDQALFTLERDSVENTALMASASGWVGAKRISPTQWRAEIPVREDYGPNITFSVVYVKGGEYVFQNLGLRVEQPRIDLAVLADKAVYTPGDTVTLDVSALIGGKPADGAQLTIGVVDEMVYVLQPDIAPNIFDFFYHPRRNNVRTSASLNFIAYDLAKPPTGAAMPSRRQVHERVIKILERPRRDDKDTAFWQPTVTVDSAGHAKVSFAMPDSLTRWRVTVRAAMPSGAVGQAVSYVRSDKDFYVKWTSPNWMRAQDAPIASVALFNQGGKEAAVELAASGAGLQRRDMIKLKPGVNFVSLPLNVGGNDAGVDLALSAGGKKVDALTVSLKIAPAHWRSQRSLSLPITSRETPLKLPPDASNVRLQFADNATAHFRRLMDDLIDYPYGCVEQTSSRLIPYSLALKAVLPSEERMTAQLTQRLHSYRFRLAQMAGPQATFGWWSPPDGDATADPLLTAYAYYADWFASDALKLALPPGHFDRLIEVYRKQGASRSPWHRALILSWMQEMGLPVRSLAEALSQDIAASSGGQREIRPSPFSSLVFASEESGLQTAMATVLIAHVVKQTQGAIPSAMQAQLDLAAEQIRRAETPLGDALLLMTGRRPTQDIGGVLEKVRAEMPTIDRALTLLWSFHALNGGQSGAAGNALRAAISRIEPEKRWQAAATATGQRLFHWPSVGPAPASITLSAPPAAHSTAIVQFESSEPEKSTLPVQLERRFYRMVRMNDSEAAAAPTSPKKRGQTETKAPSDNPVYRLELLAADAPLKTDEVYLDELRLTPTLSDGALRFGVIEAPLPPGANADRSTWGVSILAPHAEAVEALERARFEETPRGYAVPVESLSGEFVVRHLVRVSQTGRFNLPSARYYRMYQPEAKAYEEKARAYIDIR
ncbi:MAG TPA: alpha-2-macroglobulin [Burkholderiales bacterium]|nr:alpha-2-macroglobulin [Burkholderiales bacterium]